MYIIEEQSRADVSYMLLPLLHCTEEQSRAGVSYYVITLWVTTDIILLPYRV